ncbi:MAG: hypothetical protein NVS4B3_26600 [Gemmatimonadaceae bacterium]
MIDVDTVRPPRWADLLLRASLSVRDVECVSGDFLEEYAARAYAARGLWRADLWFVGHAVAIAARNVALSAAMLALMCLTRTAIDWRLPTADLHARSVVTTVACATILLLVGVRAGVRCDSVSSSAIAGILTAIVAAPLQIAGALLLLATWHDPATLAAVHDSGGLQETLTLPVMMVVPGVVLGLGGGTIGRGIRMLRAR